ncbi:MAG: DUF503 domain-containing protein [Planctomycetota bacterium]
MSTTAGLVHLRLYVGQANSLKDKRRIVKSFKTRLSNGFNVSVAEVDGLNSHRSVVLAVAMVGNDRRYVESALQRIVNAAGDSRDMVLTDHEIEWL